MEQEPFVTTSCVVCGGRTFIAICTAKDVAAQLHYLEHFHRRRLCTRSTDEFADRATFTQDYVTNVVACSGCGLVFRTPHPSAQAITAAYQSDHYGQARLAVLFTAQLHSYRRKAQTLQRLLPRNRRASVLEVGSFVGGFLVAGQERGWEMLGVDPGEEVNAFCREKGLPVYCGTLAELPLTAPRVDAVTIWNTFDQLPDPEATLARVRHILQPDGLLVIRIPNGECFRWAVTQLRTLPRPGSHWLLATLAWNNLLAFPYLYGYSVRTLDRLLRGYGFTRVAVQYDTLMLLADRHTKRWATVEERLLKSLCMFAARIEQLRAANPTRIVPWLDIYYQLPLPQETVVQPLVSKQLQVTGLRWSGVS